MDTLQVFMANSNSQRSARILQLLYYLHESVYPGSGQDIHEPAPPSSSAAAAVTSSDTAETETKSVSAASKDDSDEKPVASLGLTLWAPLLNAMRDACVTPDRGGRREIQMRALRHLQRMLLDVEANALTPEEWHWAFVSLVFPVLEELLKQARAASTTQATGGQAAAPRVAQAPPDAAIPDETADGGDAYVVVGGEPSAAKEGGGDGDDPNDLVIILAITMMAKTFLHKLAALATLRNFHVLWLAVLRNFQHSVRTTQEVAAARDSPVPDAVRELVKNMLLVMHTTGIFDAGADTAGEELWAVTWAAAEPFLPGVDPAVFVKA